MHVRNWIEKVLWKDKSFLGPHGLGPFFYLFSCLFYFLASIRNLGYCLGVFASTKAPLKVLSIGNLQIGGTGKTPFTIFLAEKLMLSGKKVAVLSRGYAYQAEREKKPIALSLGKGPRYPALFAGDEPVMIAKRLPSVFSFVGKDRRMAAQMAATNKCQIALLDDAFQQRRLKKDLEIVLLDAKDPFANQHLLPRGPLREGPRALKRAHLVCLSGVTESRDYCQAKALISRYTEAPVIGLSLKVHGAFNAKNQKVDISKRSLSLVAAIARPERFTLAVKDQGADVLQEFFFPDHQNIHDEEILEISMRARLAGADFLICSEKDWHRWETVPKTDLELLYLKISSEIFEGKAVFDQCIKRFLLD